jgi:hypothetical protein
MFMRHVFLFFRFTLNSTSGQITLTANNTLDYERQTEYTFLVFAVDMGTPPQTSAANVLISVTDYNDIKPVFTLPVYTARVVEFETTFESPVVVTVSR